MTSSSVPKVKFSNIKRSLWFLLPVVILGLAVHLILPQFASLQNSLFVIKNLVWWAFALAFLAQIASYLSSGYLLTALAELSKSYLSILGGTVITLAGASFGMVAGGMVGSSAATYRWMKKKKVSSETATLAGSIPALFNDIVLVFVSIIGVIHLLVVHQLTRLQGTSFAAVLIVLVGLIGFTAWGLTKREPLLRFANRMGNWWAKIRGREFNAQKVENWLSRLFTAASLLFSGGWSAAMLGAVLNVAFDMLTLFFLFMAAGHPVSLGVLLTGYGLPLLLGKMAFFIPGGVGIIESTMTALYVSLGIAHPEAVVVVLAYRILSFWLPLVLGFPMIWVLEQKIFRTHQPK